MLYPTWYDLSRDQNPSQFSVYRRLLYIIYYSVRIQLSYYTRPSNIMKCHIGFECCWHIAWSLQQGLQSSCWIARKAACKYCQCFVAVGDGQTQHIPTHTIHVWYISLHLADFYGKFRQIRHTLWYGPQYGPWIIRIISGFTIWEWPAGDISGVEVDSWYIFVDIKVLTTVAFLIGHFFRHKRILQLIVSAREIQCHLANSDLKHSSSWFISPQDWWVFEEFLNVEPDCLRSLEWHIIHVLLGLFENRYFWGLPKTPVHSG